MQKSQIKGKKKKKQKNIHSAWDFYTEVGYN